MTRFLTLLAATLATAVSAQQMGGSNNNNMMGGSSMNNKDMGSSMNKNMGSSMNQQKDSSMMGSDMNMQAWQGMQQSQNPQQAGVVIIAVNNGGKSQWKQMSSSDNMYKGQMQGSPQTHMVTVGAPGLAYTPNTIQAKPGDYVMFQFMSENHTATQSSFDKPCVKMMGGMDSGFMPNPKNGTSPPPMMKMQVMNSMPMWFYCKQKMPKGHCGSGMTFSINPTAQKSQAMFQQMAMQQNGTMGSSSMMAPPSMSTTQSNSQQPPSNVVQGMGQQQNGQCKCQCLCGSNAYAPGLGIGMMGGMGGMMPMSPAN